MPKHEIMKPYLVYYDEGYPEGDVFFDFDTEEERDKKYIELVNNIDKDAIIYVMNTKKFAYMEVHETKQK